MRRFITYLAVTLISVGTTWVIAQPPVATTPAAPADDLTPDERIAVTVYQSANRSVVHIATRSLAPDDLLGMFPRAGTGSGSVLDKAGHIVTNFHVVENAKRIEVMLADGSVFEARPVGADPNNDLAVIKIDAPADKLFPLPWGDSGKMLVGMKVYAIGNPFGLERTLTTGIVSSLNRSLRTENNRMIRGIIQTDAAINPGNSGGPLLDKHGTLVGITTAIISRSGSSAGVGLAIPSSVARRVVDELIRNGRIVRPDSGIFSVFETDKGLLVNKMTPGGPAEKARLKGPEEKDVQRGPLTYHMIDRSKADRIISVDGRKVKTLDDLLSYVETKKAGETVRILVIRDGKELDLPLTLAGPTESGRVN
jgi:S1-C subfamily serine protease